MRVQICAVGRLRSGSEKALIDDYSARFDRTGRALGLGPLSLHEVEDKKGGGYGGGGNAFGQNHPRWCLYRGDG